MHAHTEGESKTTATKDSIVRLRNTMSTNDKVKKKNNKEADLLRGG